MIIFQFFMEITGQSIYLSKISAQYYFRFNFCNRFNRLTIAKNSLSLSHIPSTQFLSIINYFIKTYKNSSSKPVSENCWNSSSMFSPSIRLQPKSAYLRSPGPSTRIYTKRCLLLLCTSRLRGKRCIYKKEFDIQNIIFQPT